MLPLMHARAWAAASLLLIGAVLYGSLAPNPHVPTLGTHDKFQHAFAYTVLTVWFTGFVPRGHFWRVALALVGLGVAIEFLQFSMHLGRRGDPLDMVANVLGICAGLALGAAYTGGWAPRVEAWLTRN